MKKAQYWIKHLQLIEHPEGGYYAEVYKNTGEIPASVLPDHYTSARSMATHIYFLVNNKGFSAFHRLDSDELWHFYAGKPLRIHVIDETGNYTQILLGTEIEKGESFFACVPAGTWFAAEVLEPDSFALVGCTMAPGFDFSGFELARSQELTDLFPQHAALIHRLTRS